MKYLSDKYQVADHWYPKDLQCRARVDCFMAWQHLNLRLGGAMVFKLQVSLIMWSILISSQLWCTCDVVR